MAAAAGDAGSGRRRGGGGPVPVARRPADAWSIPTCRRRRRLRPAASSRLRTCRGRPPRPPAAPIQGDAAPAPGARPRRHAAVAKAAGRDGGRRPTPRRAWPIGSLPTASAWPSAPRQRRRRGSVATQAGTRQGLHRCAGRHPLARERPADQPDQRRRRARVPVGRGARRAPEEQPARASANAAERSRRCRRR